MAYRDPYDPPRYPPPQQTEYDEPFNPYSNDQPHGTYDQGGYNYDNSGNNGGQYTQYTDDVSTKVAEKVTYEMDDAIPDRPTVPKTSRNLRKWRYEHNEDLWTRGGGLRTCGRFFCCTLMIAVFIFISVVLSLVLWVRPPSGFISGFGLVQNDSLLTVDNSTLKILFDINATINNPNYFAVDITDLKIDLFYPLNNTPMGGGESRNIDFRSDKQTNVTFFATLQYNFSADPNQGVLVDIAEKCGVVPGVASSKIAIDYKAQIGVKVLDIPVHVPLSGTESFVCPLSKDNIGEIIQSSGLESILNGLFGRNPADLIRAFLRDDDLGRDEGS